ncbi:MAG: hypothetical protein KDA60_04875 [Planctomycetales bacterium]|nr:hypothetical protein [Planctomycetales bacterium]
MNLRDLFPNLTDDNHEITSPCTIDYNCIAWAANNTQRWWQPGVFWPNESTRDDYGIGELALAFESLGFETCQDGTVEPGYDKVALYAVGMMYTHAARQLPDGCWTSKIGQLEDITHTTTEALENSDYGEVIQFMRRRRAQVSAFQTNDLS